MAAFSAANITFDANKYFICPITLPRAFRACRNVGISRSTDLFLRKFLFIVTMKYIAVN
jgi:hypothetical protein